MKKRVRSVNNFRVRLDPMQILGSSLDGWHTNPRSHGMIHFCEFQRLDCLYQCEGCWPEFHIKSSIKLCKSPTAVAREENSFMILCSATKNINAFKDFVWTFGINRPVTLKGNVLIEEIVCLLTNISIGSCSFCSAKTLVGLRVSASFLRIKQEFFFFERSLLF